MWSPNPFAIAQLLLPDGRTRDYDKDWGAAQSLLEDAFRLKLDMIFFPEQSGPPGMQLFRDFAKQFRKPRTMGSIMNAIKRQPLGQAAIEHFGSESIERVLPFLVPVKGSSFGRPGARDSQPGQVGVYRPLGAFLNGEASYLQPRQGMVADCYLISSMISLAWAAPTQWQKVLDETCSHGLTGERYRFDFSMDHKGTPYPDGMHGPPIDVQPWVPADPLNRPYFAGPWMQPPKVDVPASPDAPAPPDTPAPPATPAWPALVEKAFVAQLCQLGNEDPAPADYQFIGDVQHRWFPMDACRMLTGASSDQSHCAAKGSSPSLVQQIVRDHRGVTLHPTMATTDPNANGSIEQKGLWQASGLHSGHAYAVLGCVTQAAVDYVVLRNPWGVSSTDIPDYAQGSWQPGRDRGQRDNGEDTVVLNQCGVFAIPVAWFEACFSRVDWVELEPVHP